MKLHSLLLGAVLAAGVLAADRPVDPTFLHRFVPEVRPNPADAATPNCQYRPVFGDGDSWARLARGVSRYGELSVAPGGACAAVGYPREEHVHVVLEGSGVLEYDEGRHELRKHDFYYLPPGVRRRVANAGREPLRLLVMGFRIPAGMAVTAPETLQIANIDDVPLQVVGNHPPSTKYRLLMGDRKSTRDRIAAGHVLTSLFIMEFEPSGTNFPHHHETEEEIYLLLEGQGEMVAGGGMDGIEGRHPARAGDAYFFRLNCTVGFYNAGPPSTARARILAVRSLFPFRR
jgi:mannose-6-phosphate isomerase-like protein (cupin superfamily)